MRRRAPEDKNPCPSPDKGLLLLGKCTCAIYSAGAAGALGAATNRL